MRTISIIFFVLAFGVTTGCTNKPSAPVPVNSTPATPVVISPALQVQLSTLAGGSAATIYIVTQQPPVEQVVVLRTIVDQINSAAGAIPAGGFVTLQPKFNALIDAQVSDQIGNLAAKELVSALLSALDSFLSSHADWSIDATQATAIVSGFCTGASVALSDYKAKGLEQFKRERGVTVEYVPAPASPGEKSFTPLVRFKDDCMNGRCPLRH